VKDDEHFIVWMRTAALPSFRKLWGRIESDISAGTTIHIDIENRYNSYRFGGKKKVRQFEYCMVCSCALCMKKWHLAAGTC